MSQFGGGKPPGQWGRPAAPGAAGQLSGFPAVNVGGFSMVGMGVPMGMVNQAAFSSPNVLGMQGIMGAVPQQTLQQTQFQTAAAANNLQQASGKNQRTFVGVVTKMLDTYGFVDDDVFFQHSVIRGAHPRVGDKVMVEASYNPAMPFKWNAYRIQLLNAASQGQPEPAARQPAQQPQHHNQGGRQQETSRWANNSNDRNGRETSPRDRGNANSRRHSPPRRQSPPRRNSSPKRERVRETRRSPPPQRRASPPPRRASPVRVDRKRERSPSGSVAPSVRRDSASPPRRRARIIPRYECKIQRPALLGEIISGSTLRHRYNKLYLPSDYVDLSFDWVKNVPLDLALDLNNQINFHVFHKDVENPFGNVVLPEFEPEDADHRHQVKVLLLSHAGKSEILKKAFCLLPDGSTDDNQEPQSFWKNLQFLVGVRGKETMAIGGSWSPSLDGQDPTSPATMIKTAVRTTRALTGIDLSEVSQWLSLAQIRYYRADKQRVDLVNLLLPDTQCLSPADADWSKVEEAIGAQLKSKIELIDAMRIEEEPEPEPVIVETTEKPTEEAPVKEEPEVKEKEQSIAEEANNVTMESENGDLSIDNGENPTPQSSGPTNWSKLDPKSMKVAELRTELEVRGLETKGIKTLLVQRLQTALDNEKAAEPKDVEMKDESDVKVEGADENPAAFIAPSVEESKAKNEAEAKKEAEDAEKRKKKEEALEKEKKEKKELLEKHYQLPKEKRICVYPSKNYKSGKFDCKVMTVSSLLDYRSDDNKESQFEVSLFVEAFREMIERNAAFTIYETLANCGDRELEKKRREEARIKKVVVEAKQEDETIPAENETVAEAEKKESPEKEKKEEIEKVELKSIVANKTVYEAFSLFDINLCGYLSEKDAEDILYNGEFGISRGQIQKLTKKLAVRDKINYRHLTDTLSDLDGNVRYTPAGADDVVETDELMRGYGKALLANETTNGIADKKTAATSEDGVVVFNGSVINIAQKLKLLKQAENERDAAKSTINEQSSLIEQLREAKQDIEKKRKDIDSHYQKASKKLSEVTSQLKTTQDDHSVLKQALQDCKRHADRIFGVVEKALPPPPRKEEKKEKEKTEKSESKKEEKAAKEDSKEEDESIQEIVLAEEIGEEDVVEPQIVEEEKKE
ncbi:unnamed protein product [Caenorhabditis angaria]|uniref:SAP domain-containing ribonucleoprotein n=1 Tax=Caenorhabditis angaria TaxID=860376 RepID=A0A9P1ISE4_9PELO|nr:unnamed protein product [Caenorhabditis angaria]